MNAIELISKLYITVYSIVYMFFFSLSVFRYMIDRVSDPDQYFSVGMSSGTLTTVLPLDREEISWHNLTVVAVETSEHAHSQIDKIKISDS